LQRGQFFALFFYLRYRKFSTGLLIEKAILHLTIIFTIFVLENILNKAYAAVVNTFLDKKRQQSIKKF